MNPVIKFWEDDGDFLSEEGTKFLKKAEQVDITEAIQKNAAIRGQIGRARGNSRDVYLRRKILLAFS